MRILHDPMEIEKRSFAILSSELTVALPEENEMVIKRVIHATADFDFAETLVFSEHAVARALEALAGGCDIVTDTQMAKAGINKKVLSELGGAVHCFMSDEDVAREALRRGTTRAEVSMEKAARLEKPCAVAVGNAPTALLALYDLIDAGKIRPAFVVGAPVGFVNVVEAKETIMKADVPYIVARGRKGGSGVAAAICNALLYQLRR